ncbi:hypothetical protein COCC4DRAFT_34520 [Bipolaris maydis ATCC 48331]|uniref:Uncharacterized protein n=2 Tax=Cochliobolus heterostrophus TaxID=5016 RepID=M2SJ77_COCH5|nr:uncharacterized protein COCC4DRAFT_34520 [Bipolaris maydis ATCC 48331]EMD85370.1 hypothetical protein COCHEDRAFT_1024566 [Bipolaris maydis C5]ENI00204.1 hypothetical protein COCC4DRAFT_34520 [Bipolaris maydis ATCC 48331]
MYFLHFTHSLSSRLINILAQSPIVIASWGRPILLRVQCQVNPADAKTALQKHCDVAAFTH